MAKDNSSKLSNFKKQFEDSNATIKELKSEKAMLEESKIILLNSKDDKIKDLERTIRTKDNEISNLKGEKEKLNKELSEIKCKLNWCRKTLLVIQDIMQYVPKLEIIITKIIDKVWELSNYYDDEKVKKELSVELGFEKPEQEETKKQKQGGPKI